MEEPKKEKFICKKCGKKKYKDEFHIDLRLINGVVTSKCKKCISEYCKERDKRKEKRNQYNVI